MRRGGLFGLLTIGVRYFNEKVKETPPSTYLVKVEADRVQSQFYPEPHRGEDGRIVIENCRLYNADVKEYGAYQVQQWVKQGKYNLTPAELEKAKKEHKEKMERLYKLL